MSVGNQPSEASLNNQLTQFAVALRDACQDIINLNVQINGQNTGAATLEAAGFDSADATSYLAMLAYMNTVAGVYFGTAAQATDFNFNQELAQVCVGQ